MMSFPYEWLGLLAESPVVTPGLLWAVLGMALGVILTALLFSLKAKAVQPLTLAMLTLGVAAAFVIGMLIWLSPGEHDGPIASSSNDAQNAADEHAPQTNVSIPQTPEVPEIPEAPSVPAAVESAKAHEAVITAEVEKAVQRAQRSLNIRTADALAELERLDALGKSPDSYSEDTDIDDWNELLKLKKRVASDDLLSGEIRKELLRRIDRLVRARYEFMAREAAEIERLQKTNAQ